MHTLIIGLGNPILSDDAVGIVAARALRQALPADAPVDLVELAVGGLALMEAMLGYERVILIDALWTADSERIGQVIDCTAQEWPLTLNTSCAHDVDLPTALRLGRQLGGCLPDDSHIHILAVRAHRVLDFGEGLSPPVAAAVPKVVAQALRLLEPKGEESLVFHKKSLGETT